MPGNCDKSFQSISPRKMWDQLPFSGGFKRKNPDGFDPNEPFMDVEDSGFTAECSTKRLCTHEEWQQAVDYQTGQNSVLPATLYSHMVMDTSRNIRGEVPPIPQNNFQDDPDLLVRQRDCIPERHTVFSHDHCRTVGDSPTSSYIRCYCRPSWEAMTSVLPSGNDYH